MTGIDGAPAIALSDYVNDQFDQALSWESLDRMVDAARSAGLKVVLRGIQRVHDAESAVAHGVDVVKAIALGADAVMVGRPYLYGLGAGGERGSPGCSTTSCGVCVEEWHSAVVPRSAS